MKLCSWAYLLISAGGIERNPKKVEALLTAPKPNYIH